MIRIGTEEYMINRDEIALMISPENDGLLNRVYGIICNCSDAEITGEIIKREQRCQLRDRYLNADVTPALYHDLIFQYKLLECLKEVIKANATLINTKKYVKTINRNVKPKRN